MKLALQKTFVRTITQNYGKEGEKWLEELSGIVERCLDRWDLRLENNTYDLSYNFVSPVQTNDNREAILKIGFPLEKETLTEIDALQYFPEQYTVKLLEHDIALRACVLEKLKPGTCLREKHLENDNEATTIALPLICGIPVAIPELHDFPSLADWMNVLQRVRNMDANGGITPAILDRAQELFQKLDATKTEEKLLHGDLHHDNILFDKKRGWIAIDPKGIIGDPTFNGSRFIINNWSDTPIAQLLNARVEAIAETFGCNKDRIAAWAYVDYIITHCWRLEETGTGDIDSSLIQAFEDIIGTAL